MDDCWALEALMSTAPSRPPSRPPNRPGPGGPFPWLSHVKDHHGSHFHLNKPATNIPNGMLVSILWIVLPVLTPVGIMITALTLQRIERNVVSSRDVLVDAGPATSSREPSGCI
jgi:hypothetical protein